MSVSRVEMTRDEFSERFDRRPPLSRQIYAFTLEEFTRNYLQFSCVFTVEHCSPSGFVQGGMIAAVLDDAASQVALVAAGAEHLVPTLEMKLSFYAGVTPGPYRAKGQVRRLGKSIAHLNAILIGPDKSVMAELSATSLLKKRRQL